MKGWKTMSTTIFDKILSGELPSYKIYEDDTVYAFLDISQVTLGHTLVIPKTPTLSLLETDDDLAAHVFRVATKLAKKLVAALDADGCNILTNAHPSAGQEVMHFHVHILPRFEHDAGIGVKFVTTKPTSEQLAALQVQLVQDELN